jgi:hypothetical protein
MGALGGTRTPNLLIRSQMLYPLSYERRRTPHSVRHFASGLRWRPCRRAIRATELPVHIMHYKVHSGQPVSTNSSGVMVRTGASCGRRVSGSMEPLEVAILPLCLISGVYHNG